MQFAINETKERSKMSGENPALSLPISVHGGKAVCLTEIFRDEVNLAVWKRRLAFLILKMQCYNVKWSFYV
jgi:hypothetical protein